MWDESELKPFDLRIQEGSFLSKFMLGIDANVYDCIIILLYNIGSFFTKIVGFFMII